MKWVCERCGRVFDERPTSCPCPCVASAALRYGAATAPTPTAEDMRVLMLRAGRLLDALDRAAPTFDRKPRLSLDGEARSRLHSDANALRATLAYFAERGFKQ